MEGHVVDLVVRGERECLCANLHADGLTLRLRVDVAFVVEDPVEVAVPVERHDVFALPVFAVDFLQEVVPRVVSIVWRVEPVAVVILKRGEVVVLVGLRVSVCRIVAEIRRHGVAVREFLVHRASGDGVEVLAMTLRIRSRRHEELVVLVADFCIDFSRAVVGQGTRPIVVSTATECQGGELQLLVRADATHPQCTCVEGADAAAFRHFVRSLARGAVLPQRSTRFDEGTDVVPFEVAESCGWGASRRTKGGLGMAARGFTRGSGTHVFVPPSGGGDETQGGE